MLRALNSLVFLLAFGLAVAAQTNNLGTVELQTDLKTKSVQIAGSPELVGLASTAFRTHGAFRVVGSGAAYKVDFSAAGGNEVRVDITTGNPPHTVFSQTTAGANMRNALLRAADLAVEQLTGLKGYFAGKLAFISDRTGHSEVYTSDLFFGEVSQITRDRADALAPRWSPEGGRIIYTSFFRGGTPDIYIIDTRSGVRTTFASFKGTNSGAHFSPDGSQVAAVLSAGGNQEVFVGQPAGRGFRRLTNSPSVKASPVWSPDGSRLLFTCDRDGRAQLFLMSAAGGTMSRVPTSISGYCAEPDWSTAKPSLIAFTAAQGAAFEVAIYDVNAGTHRFVTKGPGDGIEPCWLADGRHLIYTARSAGTRRLMIVDTETGKTTALSASGAGQVSQANYWKR